MTNILGFVGLGKMGQNMVLHLLENGLDVVVYNRTPETTKQFIALATDQKVEGVGTLTPAEDLSAFVAKLGSPKIVFLMVSAGKPVDDVIAELVEAGMKKGDVIIDGGNSHYKDTVRRHKELAKKGITYIDCGTSGGLDGARYGACLMLGGDEETINDLGWLWDALAGPVGNDEGCCSDDACGGCGDGACAQDYSKEDCGEDCEHGDNCKDCCDEKGGLVRRSFSEGGWARVGESGAGHFVKMVHNGVEYGMNQALGEGFEILSKGPYKLNYKHIADLWNHGSIVRGYLVSLLVDAFAHDPKLADLTGKVAGGETGKWTVEAAHELGVAVPVIEESIQAREKSHSKPTFGSKVVSALRRGYGGHGEAK